MRWNTAVHPIQRLTSFTHCGSCFESRYKGIDKRTVRKISTPRNEKRRSAFGDKIHPLTVFFPRNGICFSKSAAIAVRSKKRAVLNRPEAEGVHTVFTRLHPPSATGIIADSLNFKKSGCNMVNCVAADDDHVIARPFTKKEGKYVRTENRKDYAIPPFEDTILDGLHGQGLPVVAIGKIEDIFCHRGIDVVDHTKNNETGVAATERFIADGTGSFIFTNLVDFDMLYGHRRDVEGYAKALERFDEQLPDIMGLMKDEDILFITADHGCDPTHHGTDHTREHIPLLVAGKPVKGGVDLGVRQSFADIAANIYDYLTGAPWHAGTSFLKDILK